MGRSVLTTLSTLDRVERLFGFDPDPASLEESKKIDRVEPVADLESIWGNPAIKLVFITAPNHSHKDLAIAALRAGKAVMLEKPIALTMEDSAEVVKVAQEEQAFLQIGFELRYSTLYTQVKEWIDEGKIGQVINIHSNYICSEFHGKHSWRGRNDSGGSMMGEKLSHYLDLPRWWTGDEVKEVYGASAPNVVPYFEVHDNYHLIYRFTGGAVGHLTFMMAVAETFHGDPLENPVSQQAEDGHELRFLITGTKGAIATDVFRRTLRRWKFGDSPDRLTSQIVERKTWTPEDDHTWFHNTTDQAIDIVHRVSEGRGPLTLPQDSLETMRLVTAAEESVDQGRIISLLG